ncbi:MAG: hypothetical protein ABFD90_20755 [Phycisphaerales bacterium]
MMKTEFLTVIPRPAHRIGSTGVHQPLVSRCPGRRLAAVMLLLAGTSGMATAKSMYVIAQIVNFDGDLPIHVYDIGTDGRLTYQTEFGAPFIGAGMVGIAMDSDSGYLFCTYENSGRVLVVDAATLEQKAVLAVPNAANLAGIVYDHEKGLLYCSERGTETLYVLRWDAAKGTLASVLGAPFTLEGAQAYGIALDEYNDLLYVASGGQGVSVYSTWDWNLVQTLPTSRNALSIAVDPERDCLYYGGGYFDNLYLSRYGLSNGVTTETLVDPNAGVMGLGVDPNTGLVYVTTGRDNRPGGKDLMVFDTSLRQLQTIEDIGRPTGLAIPVHNTSFNPLHLTKTVASGLGGKPNDDGLYYIVIGDEVTYSICFEDAGYGLTEVSIVDRLPAELAFVTATGNGTFGRYDDDAHAYTWDNPPMTTGAATRLELVCRLQSGTTPGQIVTNRVTIDSDKTPPSTIGVGAVVTEATYSPLNLHKVVVSPEAGDGDKSVVYAYPGGDVTYRICFDNLDNDYAVSNIAIVDTLPQQMDFVGATGDGVFGGYSRSTHSYTWTYSSLRAGQSDCVDLVVRLSKSVPTGAIITNHVTIRSDQTPQVSQEAAVTVAYAPVEVEMTVISPTGETDERGRPCVGAGEKVTYAVELRNPSQDVAVTQVTIVAGLPPEMTFVSADGDKDFGSYDAKAHTYTWVYPLLTAGGELRLELTAQVNGTVEARTVLSNVVAVTSKQAAPSRARADVVVCNGAVRAQMAVKPNYVWRNRSAGTQQVMVVIHLPEGYGMERIVDTPLVLTPGDAQSTDMRVYGSSTQGKILCFFDTAPLLAATEGYGEFSIQVTGTLTGGISFVCNATISILGSGSP